MNRWFLYGPFIAAGVILVIWFMIWRAGAALMRSSLDEFAAAQAGNRVVVNYDSLTTRGFPFFLRGVVANLSVDDGDDRWRVERLYIDALPYAPDRLIFSPAEEEPVHLRRGAAEWTINAAGARVSIERDKERRWRLKAESGPLSATDGSGVVSIGGMLFNLAPDATERAAFDASLRAVDLGFSAPDGRYSVERIDAAFTLGAPVQGRRPVIVHGLAAVMDGTEIAAEGMVSAGGGAPAAGRLNAEIRKPEGLAALIARSPHLRPDEARAAVAGLGMLSAASGGVIRAPIDVANGAVSVAGVKIAAFDQP